MKRMLNTFRATSALTALGLVVLAYLAAVALPRAGRDFQWRRLPS
jgi:hypothetical protein